MQGRPLWCVAFIAAALGAAAPAGAAELRVLSAGAVEAAEEALAADYTRETGQPVVFTFAPVGTLQDKLKAGEPADVVVLSAPAIAAMSRSGALRPGSTAALGRIGIGVAIREGAAKPDIATPIDLRRTLLAARSIVYADPAKGASSGIYVAHMLEQLGIADAVKDKEILEPGGYVVERVAKGDAELGIHQISEILPVKGVTLVGPLPAPLQHYTAYEAGVSAASAQPEEAQAFIAFLTRPANAARWQAAGVEPSGDGAAVAAPPPAPKAVPAPPSGAMPAAAPAAAVPPPPPPSKAGLIAALYGRALGNASECPEADPQRIGRITELAAAHVRAIAANSQDAAAAGQRLAAAVGDGRQDVRNGAVTCIQAMAEPGNIERDLGSPRPAAATPR